MTFRDTAEESTKDILFSLGGEDVLFYPVPASQIAAYGGSAVTLTGDCSVEELPTLDDDGNIDIDNVQVVLNLDPVTVAANSIQRRVTSVVALGVKYDIIRMVDDKLGRVACYLEEYR